MTLIFDRPVSSLRAAIWCTTLAASLNNVAWAADATAGSDDEALQHYERAIALHADEAYDAALVELRRAYELRPSYKLIFNMAQVQVAMKDYAAALTSYRRYLDEGGGDVPEKRRDEIEAQIAVLEQRVATLTLTTDVPGVEVFIDDSLVGTTPNLAPLSVNAGTRKFTLRHPDYDVQTERVSVLGGTQKQLAFSLSQRKVTELPSTATTDATSASAPANAPVTSDATEESFRVEPWMPWVVTGVFGAAAVTTGAFASSADSKLSDMRGQADLPRATLQDQADHVDNLALATDILLGATVVAAGVSAWLTWGGTSQSESTRSDTTPSVWLGIGPRAAVLSGRF